jgi:hypothetical protein
MTNSAGPRIRVETHRPPDESLTIHVTESDAEEVFRDLRDAGLDVQGPLIELSVPEIVEMWVSSSDLAPPAVTNLGPTPPVRCRRADRDELPVLVRNRSSGRQVVALRDVELDPAFAFPG